MSKIECLLEYLVDKIIFYLDSIFFFFRLFISYYMIVNFNHNVYGNL